MGITIEELKKLDKNTYQIIDIRDENEIAHGAIPGAVATPADSKSFFCGCHPVFWLFPVQR